MDSQKADTVPGSLGATQSKFLALPREIKDMIAKYALLCPRAGKGPEHEKWRGTTNILRLCRQTYVESHEILHDQPAHISQVYRGQKWNKPTTPREARHWEYTVDLDSRYHNKNYTTHQIRQFSNVIISIFYFEWEELPLHKIKGWGYPTLKEEMIDHLKQYQRNFKELVKVMRTCPHLEKPTLRFTRWVEVPTDQIHPDSPVYPSLMGFCEDLVTLSPKINIVAESITYLMSHQIAVNMEDLEGVSDTDLPPKIGPVAERKELLAHLFNKARQEWLQSQHRQRLIRLQTAPSVLVELADDAPSDSSVNTSSYNASPNITTDSSATQTYRPFLGREKYMVRLEVHRAERERKQETVVTRGSSEKLPVSKTLTPKYRCKLRCCTYETSSRKAFRRHLYVRRHTFHQDRNPIALSSSKNPRLHLRCTVCVETFKDRNEYAEHVRVYRYFPNHWVDRNMYLYDIQYLFRTREWYRTQLFVDIASAFFTLFFMVFGLPDIRSFISDADIRNGITISTIPEQSVWFKTKDDQQNRLRDMIEEAETGEEHSESNVISFAQSFGAGKALIDFEDSANEDVGYVPMAGVFLMFSLGILIVYLFTQ